MLPKNRPPTAPGELLLEEFLEPMGLTQTELAARMGVPVQSVNLLIKGKREVTARTAVLLAEVLGTTPELWLHAQMQRNLWFALQERAEAAKSPRLRAVRPRSLKAARRAPAARKGAKSQPRPVHSR
ncbi:MAG: HigA family addiction module antitoxin [Myxococcaceae bacterium]|nr:HigA family addiction module antitoxin [Myxococcaceae bacterium]MCI0673121.1 HigA family addiction module antitoxin [Myxococcaceae bacterium]